MPFRIVIAPDSFKGSLSAREVADAIAEGWRAVRPDDELRLLPQADGGEGTLDAIQGAVPDAIRHTVPTVTGPDGEPTTGEWLELPGGIAVVDLAQMSGLPLMGALDAMGATTRGLGEVTHAALDHGVERLIVGLGGSASTDGGMGALTALGLRLLDEFGDPLPDGGGHLRALATIDDSGLLPPPPGGVTLLTDVTAPLLGEAGAAAVFGPQKGADDLQVIQLDDALRHLVGLLGGAPDAPGAGAAGGAGYGFATVWGATIEPGADYLAALTGLADSLAGADLLLTGEGRFDQQSLGGKVVGQLLQRAAEKGVTAAVIAGQVTAQTEVWAASLTELAGTAEASMAEPVRWLRAAGERAARELGR